MQTFHHNKVKTSLHKHFAIMRPSLVADVTRTIVQRARMTIWEDSLTVFVADR